MFANLKFQIVDQFNHLDCLQLSFHSDWEFALFINIIHSYVLLSKVNALPFSFIKVLSHFNLAQFNWILLDWRFHCDLNYFVMTNLHCRVFCFLHHFHLYFLKEFPIYNSVFFYHFNWLIISLLQIWHLFIECLNDFEINQSFLMIQGHSVWESAFLFKKLRFIFQYFYLWFKFLWSISCELWNRSSDHSLYLTDLFSWLLLPNWVHLKLLLKDFACRERSCW